MWNSGSNTQHPLHTGSSPLNSTNIFLYRLTQAKSTIVDLQGSYPFSNKVLHQSMVRDYDLWLYFTNIDKDPMVSRSREDMSLTTSVVRTYWLMRVQFTVMVQVLSGALRTTAGDLRVFAHAHAQVLEGQEAAGVEGHQHLGSLHNVQAKGPRAHDQPLLPLRTQRQHHAIIILGHQWHTTHPAGRRERQE